jgi:hypothetical protein
MEVKGKLDNGFPDFYRRSIADPAAPIAALLHCPDEPLRKKIRKEVHELLGNGLIPGRTILTYSALVFSGQK